MRVRPEWTGSADLFIHAELGPGALWSYVEGSTSPLMDGVSTLIPEANTDAATALGANRSGRVQISELNYRWELADGDRITVGLLDATGYLDVSRIANDENLFFLGVSFVNNPTIEFPDYALGIVTQRRQRGRIPRITMLVSSADGLADNPGLSYSELIGLRDPGEGVFAALGLRWTGERNRVGIGVWQRSDQQPLLTDSIGRGSSSGAFAVLGRSWEHHALNVRAGLGNAQTYLPSRFVGLTYLAEYSAVALGAGLARTWPARNPGAHPHADVSHAELFLRTELWRGIYVTPSLQILNNPGFDASGSVAPPRLRVFGVRLSWAF